MKNFLRGIIVLIACVAIFLFLFSVETNTVGDYPKLRIVNKAATYGVVLRMKPEGWELWKLQNKVEMAEIFEKEFDFINQYFLKLPKNDTTEKV